MLPESWLPFVHHPELRNDRTWINQFGRTRRTYILGFALTSLAVGRSEASAVYSGQSPRFAEDPRRYIPVPGWRGLFAEDGEKFEDSGTYKEPPPGEKVHLKKNRWYAYGKDQPDHAWSRRPMRLYEIVKSIGALADALEQTGEAVSLTPSEDGKEHLAGQLSLHPALFTVGGFTASYYEEHFATNPGSLVRLFKRCGLWSSLLGAAVPTFQEMAKGLSATYRTCETLIAFCQEQDLPELGMIQADFSTRGTNRNHRHKVKESTRVGVFQPYSADCAIEIFAR